MRTNTKPDRSSPSPGPIDNSAERPVAEQPVINEGDAEGGHIVYQSSIGNDRPTVGLFHPLPSLTMVIGVALVAAILVICILGLVFWVRRKSASRWHHETKYPRLLNEAAPGRSDRLVAGGDVQQQRIPMTPLLMAAASPKSENGSLRRNHHPIPPTIVTIGDKSPSSSRRLLVHPQHPPPCLDSFPLTVTPGGDAATAKALYPADDYVPPTAAAAIANNPRSVQKQAWDRMLQRPISTADPQQLQHLTNATGGRMSISDLPPPPSYMLEDDVHEVLDGYHSADTTDEMDEVDIRLSPYYDKSHYTANV